MKRKRIQSLILAGALLASVLGSSRIAAAQIPDRTTDTEISAAFEVQEETETLEEEDVSGENKEAAEAGKADTEADMESEEADTESEEADTEAAGLAADAPELTDVEMLEYISDNLDPDAVDETADLSQECMQDMEDEEPELVETAWSRSVDVTPVDHTLTILYTLVDSTQIGDCDTITRMWAENWQAYIASYSIYAQMYTVDENMDCFVAFVNESLMNGYGELISMDLSNGDGEEPVVYNDDIIYDGETGLIYIPKAYFYGADGTELESGEEELMLQLMVSADLSRLQNQIRVTTENYRGDVEIIADEQVIREASLNVDTTIPLTTPETAANVDLSKVYLYINDSVGYHVFGSDEYYFDRQTGELTIPFSPVTLYSLRIVIDDDTWLQKLASLFVEDVYASAESVSSVSEMQALPNVTLSVTKDLSVGDYFDFTTTQQYASASGSTYYDNYTSAMISGMENSALYAHYAMVDSVESQYVDLVGYNQGTLSSLLSTGGFGSYVRAGGSLRKYLYLNQFYFISSTPNSLQTAHDGTGSIDFSELHTQYPWIGLHCTHTSSPLGDRGSSVDVFTDTCRYRVLYIDADSGYIVIGLVVPKINSQSGAAIYKLAFRYYGTVKAAKRGAQTGSALSGAVYRVYEDAACSKVAKDIYGKYELVTVSDGTYSNKLVYPDGKKLYVREYTAPAGTLLDTSVYTVTVKGSAQTCWANGAYNTGGWLNDQEYAIFTLHKTDAESGEALEGAVYTAYTDADCTTEAKDAYGNAMVWTTGADGSADAYPLRKQTFYLKETDTPEGYDLSTDVWQVVMDKDGCQITEYNENKEVVSAGEKQAWEMGQDQVPYAEMEVTDSKTLTPAYITLHLTKYDAETGLAQAQGTASLEGAVFALEYAAEEEDTESGDVWYYRTDEKGEIDFNDPAQLLAETSLHKIGTDGKTTEQLLTSSAVQTDEKGRILLPEGYYRVREISGPVGYSTKGVMKLSGKEADPEEGILITPEDGENPELEVYDTLWPCSIRLTKYGEDGKILPGAGYRLERLEEDGSSTEISEGVTDEQGKLQWEDLIPGTYRITEISAPDGYQLIDQSIEAVLPCVMTEEEVQEEKADPAQAYYDETLQAYCFCNLSYELTDQVKFTVPMAGGFDETWYPAATAVFLFLLAGTGLLITGKGKPW